MNRTTSMILAAALVATAAHRASADCTINGTGSVQKYWPSSGTTSYSTDARCDAHGTNCHLSGWLYRPTSSGTHPAIVYSTNAAHEEARWDACEVVNYFVARGYVVFVPYARGVDDISPPNANMPGEGFHNTGINYLDWSSGTSLTELEALQAEADDLAAAVEWIQGRSYVDPHKIGVMGAGAGGTRAAFLASDVFLATPQPLATIDLSGGVWDWSGDPQWETRLDNAAALHNGAILYQEVANEAPTDDYTPMLEQFTSADASDDHAKLALYAGFGITSDEQAICNNRGYGPNRCASFSFVTDGAQTGRWLDTVHFFLVQYGVTP